MYFEINVVRKGKHFFATAERSLHTEAEARVVLAVLRRALPSAEGYAFELTRWMSSGEQLPLILEDVG